MRFGGDGLFEAEAAIGPLIKRVLCVCHPNVFSEEAVLSGEKLDLLLQNFLLFLKLLQPLPENDRLLLETVSIGFQLVRKHVVL